MTSILTRHITPHGIATLTLSRPERHNAFDDHLIAALTDELAALAAAPHVRVVILAATGASFSAGADLAWMQRIATYTEAENLEDARRLAKLMHTLDTLPKPVVAAVQGSAYGGGVGLIACCDMVFSAPESHFALTEVKLGLIPAVISPYVVRKIGASHARRYFLSAERFDAETALRIGLIHAITPRDEVLASANSWAENLLHNGPLSMAAAKELIATVVDQPVCASLREECVQRIARQRVHPEGQEGLQAFFEKRAPKWHSN